MMGRKLPFSADSCTFSTEEIMSAQSFNFGSNE